MLNRCTLPMRVSRRLSKLVAPGLFFLGLLWLSALSFVSSWPDMEASFFDTETTLAADSKLQTLRCPLVISADETATVKATFRNPSDRTASFLVRTRISSGFVTLVRQDSQQVTLAPGASREFSWPFAARDAAYGRLVMARVLATKSVGQPARESSCGILVLGVSGASGSRLFAAGVLAGLALVAAGAGKWWFEHRPLDGSGLSIARRASALALVVGASLIAGLLTWWLLSHLLLIASALLALVLLEQAYAPRA